jgi:AraC-like DNA-binding protein
MLDPFAEMVTLLQPRMPFSKMASGSGAWRVNGAGVRWPFFAVMLEGSSRLAMEGQLSIDVLEGDFILIPAARDFTVSSIDPTADGLDAALETVTMLDGETRHGDPHGPANMRMLVGRLEFGLPDSALLVSLLPNLLHVRGQARLATIVKLIRGEAQDDKPAREIILERLLEVLMIEALRSASDNSNSPGLLRGLADARLSVAIRRMHEDPRNCWTVEQLANEAALSRSVFFERFRKAVGVPPMEYLLSWRMALAKSLLRHRDGGVKDVAERVGYGSASSFSVAFTRFVGMPPAHYARESIREAAS